MHGLYDLFVYNACFAILLEKSRGCKATYQVHRRDQVRTLTTKNKIKTARSSSYLVQML
jgi:hypothetical protein